MSAVGTIGGNLDDILAVADSYGGMQDETGQTTTDTAKHVDTLKTEVDRAMGELKTSFTATAQMLRDRIGEADKLLEGAAWTGNAKDQAELIRTSLMGSVNSVFDQAMANFSAEQEAFKARIEELHAHVTTEFGDVMNQVDASYVEFADAARLTAQNFSDADQTMRFAG